ncbi:MAG: DUF2383 domain-containing protein [Gammaproteobacteria bacterium]|nr:MAG: DUF2383 domain-containing protein [Gammaproteobacteria bacterium]
MKFFRTDAQAALNSLLVTARETLDHYRDAAELVEPKLAEAFKNISRLRRDFIGALENAVRESGDLPAVPDPDKEAGAMLLHHVVAAIKDDYAGDLISQRIEAEQTLLEQLAEAKVIELNAAQKLLMDELSEHVSQTIQHLQTLQTQIPTRENA